MNTLVEKSRKSVLQWYQALSKREQAAVVGISLFLSLIFIYAYIISPIYGIYLDNIAKLEDSNRSFQTLPYVLSRYKKLQSRQSEIEKLYQSIEQRESVLAHLEELVKNTAGIPSSSFTIYEQATRKFANKYEQVPYQIKFSITDYARLVDFLEALVKGKNPLIITSLDMQKSPIGDHIAVNMEVSSVRKINGN